jgi:PKD repeat protein
MDAKSNHTFEMHAKRPELYQSIKKYKWDFVIIQGFSRELAQDTSLIDSLSLPFLKQILDSVYANNSCTNVFLYQTWAYQNGFQDDSLQISWDYQTMSDRIHYGYNYVADRLNLAIVPVGRAWEAVRTNYPEIKLYQEDQQHPTLTGSYLTASCFYAALFKANPKVSYQANIDDKTAALLQDLAGTTVLTNKNRYGINVNTVDIEVKLNDANKKVVHYSANFPNATSVVWEFGDGYTAPTSKARHIYAKPGVYSIKVKVQDSCGQRIIKRSVKV